MTDPTSLPNFPPPPNEHPLRGRVLDVLVDLGLQPNLDNDGDVAFTVNEQQLFVRCTEGEVEIMRVFGQWQIQDDLLGDRLQLHETCNELNLNMNCVKTGVAGLDPRRHGRAPRDPGRRRLRPWCRCRSR